MLSAHHIELLPCACLIQDAAGRAGAHTVPCTIDVALLSPPVHVSFSTARCPSWSRGNPRTFHKTRSPRDSCSFCFHLYEASKSLSLSPTPPKPPPETHVCRRLTRLRRRPRQNGPQDHYYRPGSEFTDPDPHVCSSRRIYPTYPADTILLLNLLDCRISCLI